MTKVFKVCLNRPTIMFCACNKVMINRREGEEEEEEERREKKKRQRKEERRKKKDSNNMDKVNIQGKVPSYR